jgi:peptidoglycan hydrolase-like protein with peptidoglycan-binding domain
VQPGVGQVGPGSSTPDAGKGIGATGQASVESVRSAQQALQSKGMDPGPTDGIIGPRTQSALRAYQKEQNLPQTGQLDDQTRLKLGIP